MVKYILVACLVLSGCTAGETPTPPLTLKVARPVRDTAVVATATPQPSQTPRPTETATRTTTPTLSPSPTATVAPTFTPKPTPQANPYAPPEFLGGTRRIPRAAVLAAQPPSELQVSPALFGLSYWQPPFGGKVIGAMRALNFSVIRWGGENLEVEPFDWADLDRFILDARQMNLEPLIQVPYFHKDPGFAAGMVRYVNVEKKYDVRFWSIGNEEDRNLRGGSLDKWVSSWRSYRDAMKAVDPRIVIFGPEYSQRYDFNDPTNDWLTPFLRVNGDIVDVVSLHYYPFGGDQSNPTVLVGNALGVARKVRALRDYIRSITGRDIPLAFTEMNMSHNWRDDGEGSSASFSAALWMAETLGQMADAGVWLVNIWSGRGSDSTALVEKLAETKRPTYYAAQLYSNFGDRLVPLASHVANVTAHAARDSRTGTVSLVLVNRGRVPASLNLVLNSGQEQKKGNIYFDLNSRRRIKFELPAQSMASVSLGPNLNKTGSVVFSRDMFNNGQGPVESK